VSLIGSCGSTAWVACPFSRSWTRPSVTHLPLLPRNGCFQKCPQSTAGERVCFVFFTSPSSCCYFCSPSSLSLFFLFLVFCLIHTHSQQCMSLTHSNRHALCDGASCLLLRLRSEYTKLSPGQRVAFLDELLMAQVCACWRTRGELWFLCAFI
jgi:hypothetical protein